MPSDSPATQLTCTQCGGELHPDEGQVFITCPYCAATVFVDKSRVVFHWYLAPTLTEEQAAQALARWMSGSQTVKDLDKKARVVSVRFDFFPLWYFKSKQGNAPEQVSLQPAAATSITELRKLNLPAGDLRKYDSSAAGKAIEPSVPLDAARVWTLISYPDAQITEAALVHVPIYTFKYVFRDQTYTAIVEAATGRVLASLFPAKAEAPYLLAAGLTASIYICLALLALFGGSMAAASIVLALVAAPFLFGLAVWVASKV
ncbi:MAG: hypothetical protein KA988_03705 [Longilinea sp.]|nr:hypothetical protein [Longilinea sp.]